MTQRFRVPGALARGLEGHNVSVSAVLRHACFAWLQSIGRHGSSAGHVARVPPRDHGVVDRLRREPARRLWGCEKPLCNVKLRS
jgi:hypothetical protein